MTDKLAVIKELRDKGASIKMIDDVATFVGSYLNPVVIPTVEFILKIRDIVREALQERVYTVDISQKNIGSVENVNFGAANNAVEEDEELSEDERLKMLEHLRAIEAQRNKELEADRQQGHEEEVPQRKKGSNSKSKRDSGKSGLNSLLDKLKKSLTAQLTEKHKKDGQDQQTVQNSQRQNQQNAQMSTQRTSATKMNLIKMKLLSSLKVRKDRSIYGDEQWRQGQRPVATTPLNRRNNLATQYDHSSEDAAKEAEVARAQEAARRAKQQRKFEVKNGQAVNNSKVANSKMDEIIKSDKVKNPPKELEKPAPDKGKFTQQVADKTAPKANDEAVSKMQAQEAINKLQSSGMRATNVPVDTSVKAKSDLDKQAAQNAVPPSQKQR